MLITNHNYLPELFFPYLKPYPCFPLTGSKYNTCISKDRDTYLAQVVHEDFLRPIANWFMLFCGYLTLFIFPTLLGDFQRPNWKLEEGLHLELIIAHAHVFMLAYTCSDLILLGFTYPILPNLT